MGATRSNGSAIRVLQLGPLYVPQVRRWAEHAAALGATVHAAGHVTRGRRMVDVADVAEGVEIAPPDVRDGGIHQHVAWLRALLRDVEPDLIHAHWLPRWGCAGALSGHRPVIVSAWGSDVYLPSGPARTRARWAVGRADRVLAPSPHMLRELLALGAPPDRTHQVEIGVDLERFHPASEAEAALLRQELGLPAGPLVLSTRAGTEVYNLDVVIEAFCRLRTVLPNATLVLAHGGAPLSRGVRALLRRRERAEAIRVVGDLPHSDVARFMRCATVGVSIPASDGSPKSVWEALACGLPMVLSDLPQIRERLDGSGAAAFTEAHADGLASELHSLLTRPHPRRSMALAARRWAVANVGQREQRARLARVYDEALGRVPPAGSMRAGAGRAGPRAARREPETSGLPLPS